MAKIALEGMRFHAYHGFYNEERKIGGYYTVDVYIETSLPRSAFQDDLTGTVNYENSPFYLQSSHEKAD